MAIIRGTSGDDPISGTEADDKIFAFQGDDVVDAGGGNDRILADYGDDVVNGGEGDDSIFGEHGNDTVDAGSGNDRVSGGRGQDIGVYRVSENLGANDYYDGGEGTDTLRLILTQAEFNSADIQADITAFREFLAQNKDPDKADHPVFQFTAFGLSARNWENVEVIVEPETQLPSLSIADVQVTEGDPAGPNATITFTVSRVGNNGLGSTVAYAVNPGSATTPQDYGPPAPLTGTVTFAAGETTKSITLDITDDLIPEATETFTVALSNATNATIADSQATGTILDNDLPSLSIADVSVIEGGVLKFNVSVDVANHIAPVEADYTITFTAPPGNGNADNADLPPGTPLSGKVTIPVGSILTAIEIPTFDDLLVEGNESFKITLSNLTTNVKAGDLEATGRIEDNDLIVIRNGGSVVVGSTGAPTSFNVGTDAAAPSATDRWIAGTPNRLWGEQGNWQDGTPPTAADSVVFDGAGTGNNFVDSNFNIAALTYTAAGGHVTDLTGGSQLQVSGPLSVGVANPSARGSLTIDNASVTVFGGQVNIGFKTSGSGTANGTLSLVNGAQLILTANDLSIGRETGAGNFSVTAANGSLTLDSNSALTLGSQAALATLNIGFSQNTNTNSNGASATGVLDALESAANLDLHLSELNVGRGSFRGFGTGTLKWDQTEVITAPDVYFGRGNATGILEVPVGGELHLGTATTPINNLRIAHNDAGSGTATANLDFSLNNPIFTAFIANDLSIGRETGAGNFSVTAANGSLTLDSNSALTLGSQAALATLNIGFSQNTNTNSNGASATGVLDALESAANLDLHLSELNVGRGSFRGFGTGTLKWDQTEVITAPDVYFGRGNATGILEVPVGGELHLGTATTPINNLRIAHNDAGSGTATANLDFSLNNPIFTAFIANDLSIGRETGAGNFSVTAANGSLTLDSNSALTLGSQAALATLNIGFSQNTNTNSNGASATGVLDATEGSFTAELSTLNIGRTANRGSATGEFTAGDGVTLQAATVNIGVGTNATGTLTFVDNFAGTFDATTVNLARGLLDFGNNTLSIGNGGNILVSTFNLTGGELRGDTVAVGPATGTFNFTGGRLEVDTFLGTLNENGGTLAAARDTVGSTTIVGNFNLAAAGTVEIDITGLAPGVGFDQVAVNGGVDLNGTGSTGGTLDVILGFAPSVGNVFQILQNDAADAILGTFAGLAEGATFNETFGGNVYTFSITYSGGDGNDVALTLTNVAPALLQLESVQNNSGGGTDSNALVADVTSLAPPIALPGSNQEIDGTQALPPVLDRIDGRGASDRLLGSGGTGNEMYVDGKSNDTGSTGPGADIVVFNRSDGQDIVRASTGADNTISLGGGIGDADLTLTKSGNNPVLETGGEDKLTLEDWFAAPAQRGVLNLQMIAEAMSDFAAGGSDPLRDHKIEHFDFQKVVQQFDQERVAAPNIDRWAAMNALLDAHLAGSDTEALGGDLAYRYGLTGSLAGIGAGAVQGIVDNPELGSSAQTLQPLAGLTEGLVKLR